MLPQLSPPHFDESGTLLTPPESDLEWDVNAEVWVRFQVTPDLASVVSHDALEFIAELTRRFGARRRQLLDARGEFRQRIAEGQLPGFLPETRRIRERPWRVAPPPRDLFDRRVEITGPAERKRVINALNSGAQVYMADFEDAHAPRWEQSLRGQANLMDAVRGTLEWREPDGRTYRPGRNGATLMVRPRGWHLVEPGVFVDGEPVPASLFDFGLYFFHNARALHQRGTGPYFYLPKLEHHEEAALWNDVFIVSEKRLGLPPGSTKATVLVETLPAAFEMDEILYALRSRSVGLNCGRWDYIFSFLKQFRDDPARIFPDRSELTMTAPFLAAYARLLVNTCHRRGAQAIGGMAAQVPNKLDPVATERALEAVRFDKRREHRLGYDGTWVAHPALVPVARAEFDRARRDGPPALRHRLRPPANLLATPSGSISPEGVRENVHASVRYLAHWLQGQGCVAIDHKMEDAATVEISRTLLWQWVQRAPLMTNGRPVSVDLFRSVLADEVARLRGDRTADDLPRETIERAERWLDDLVTVPALCEFFTDRAPVSISR